MSRASRSKSALPEARARRIVCSRKLAGRECSLWRRILSSKSLVQEATRSWNSSRESSSMFRKLLAFSSGEGGVHSS